MPLPLIAGLLGLAGGAQYGLNKYGDYLSGKNAEKLKNVFGTPAQQYQMSEADLFPGEQPIQDLYNRGTGLLSDVTDPEIVKQAQTYMGLLDIPQYQEAGARGLLGMAAPAEYTNIQVDASGQPWGMNTKTRQFGPVPTTGGTPMQKPYTDIGQLEADYRSGIIDKQQRDYWLNLLGAKATGKSADPFYQFLPTEQGYAVGNARTGDIAMGVVNGKPVMRATDSPELQGRITAARTTGEAGAKRDFNMMGVSDIIDTADSILATGKPTQSVIGSGMDIAAGALGMTPEGSAESDQLKVLSGFLVSKMPRMEGPQSDYDVQNYKAMAADIGNSRIPIERRRAALQLLRGIISKYDKGGQVQQPTVPSAPAQAPTTQATVRRYNPATGRFE